MAENTATKASGSWAAFSIGNKKDALIAAVKAGKDAMCEERDKHKAA